jgi:hypothetical protein
MLQRTTLQHNLVSARTCYHQSSRESRRGRSRPENAGAEGGAERTGPDNRGIVLGKAEGRSSTQHPPTSTQHAQQARSSAAATHAAGTQQHASRFANVLRAGSSNTDWPTRPSTNCRLPGVRARCCRCRDCPLRSL